MGKGGKGKGRAGPSYDPHSPCGYFLAGHCRFGNECMLQHSVPYALAIRENWLHPEDAASKESLRLAAEVLIADSTKLFPRVFSRKLVVPDSMDANSSPARRWANKRQPKEPADESSDSDGFTWDRPPESIAEGNAADAKLTHILVLDLEGKEEIIEFPVIAIDLVCQVEVGRFHRYVRPEKFQKPCAGSPAQPFKEVLVDFEQWLQALLGHGLKEMGQDQSTTSFLSCGVGQCQTKLR
mmetsp:Transcript_70357/g.124249  ORF Transcript_70357/g.124249 Transcript_70357/m.124249 type:complete len:239 (-) Transcript_70357:251-967(-)